MQLAKCKQHSADKTPTSKMVAMVGMMPDRAKVAGKSNMAGPVSELTAILIEPKVPIVPK